jgi:ribonuclease BN (tRNA processing enzyme)
VSIRLTILGKSPSWQDRDGACSGYQVEVDERQRLLLDCGNGVFGKLRRHGEYERIGAVLISHLHADHMLDLVPFAYALTYGPALLGAERPQLHAPPGAQAALRRLCGAWGSETLIENAFELREYDPAAELQIGGLRARFRLVPHYVPSYAVSLDDGGARLVFSADCGPNDALVELARGAEMLLIEATLATPDLEDGAHLTATEAGEIGRRAGVGRLVLTHFSDLLDAGTVRAAGEAAFGGPVSLAVEGESYEI